MWRPYSQITGAFFIILGYLSFLKKNDLIQFLSGLDPRIVLKYCVSHPSLGKWGLAIKMIEKEQSHPRPGYPDLDSRPLQACTMMTLGLSFRLWQLRLLKIWKIVSSGRMSGFSSLCFVPQMPSKSPCDINTRKVLSENLCSWRSANRLSAASISWKERQNYSQGTLHSLYPNHRWGYLKGAGTKESNDLD